LCYDHLNTIKIKEATDIAMVGIFEDVIEHNKKEPNPYEHYNDSYILSSYISTLGKHSRERKDHKKGQVFVYGCRTRTCWNITG
jgi:hypothetical protein